MNTFVCVDSFFDKLDILRGFGRPRIHDRICRDQSASDSDVLHFRMRQRADLIGIYAGSLNNFQRCIVNLVNCIDVKNIAFCIQSLA